MTSIAPPPLPRNSSTKTNIGVLKALLITVAIVGVIGFFGYQFVQARTDAKQIRKETQETIQKTNELNERSKRLIAACEKDASKC